jgi:prevent-host-death family protein
MINLRNIYSLTEFQRNVKNFLAQLKQTGEPLVLTVNGKAELVVQDAATYQQLLERLEYAESIALIRQSMTEFARGEGMPAREAIETLRQKYGLSS